VTAFYARTQMPSPAAVWTWRQPSASSRSDASAVSLPQTMTSTTYSSRIFDQPGLAPVRSK
jgi:hypothetical protein